MYAIALIYSKSNAVNSDVANIVISAIALFLSCPAVIFSLYNFFKNKFKLTAKFNFVKYHELFKYTQDLNTGRPIKNPTNYCRLEGFCEYVNYTNLDFSIRKIVAIHNEKKYLLCKYEPTRTSDSIEGTDILLEHIRIMPRLSGNFAFSFCIQNDLKNQNFNIKIYTSYKKRPIKTEFIVQSAKNTHNNKNNS